MELHSRLKRKVYLENHATIIGSAFLGYYINSDKDSA
ncbi:MAG: hypothetical protein K0R09_1332 [Clostridiales bacterium]|nr:hypothetical protein [Clostridiales bacterium]